MILQKRKSLHYFTKQKAVSEIAPVSRDVSKRVVLSLLINLAVLLLTRELKDLLTIKISEW